MSFLQQLIQYLSQPPDSIVYHIVTLLALQATLGLAWWQARRRPDDDFARRLAWASGAILLSRLFILLAIFATSGLIEAIALLPPLERAVDALTVAILVWALAPQPKNLPHLGAALLLIVTIVIVFLYVSFALEWRGIVEIGAAPDSYSNSPQAVVWDILQMALLALGAALVLAARESQWSLRIAILLVLFLARAMSLWLGGDIGPSNVEIPFWTRLGNVIAFPMLAVLAYRHNLHNLLPSSHMGRPVIEQLVHSLDLSGKVSRSLQPDQTLEAALTMASTILPARFMAIALVTEDRPQCLQLFARITHDLSDPIAADSDMLDEDPETRSWVLKRDDYPSFALALRTKQQVDLLPDGPGARQLHELARELKLDGLEAMLVEPMAEESAEIGLLLLSGGVSGASWLEHEKELARSVAGFLAQSLDNTRRYQLALAVQAPDFERATAALTSDLAQVTEQRDRAIEQASDLAGQLRMREDRLAIEHRKLQQTTQALAMSVQRQAKYRRLEEEVDSLNEALSEAELALASAAAGEAGLSTEWVMHTVTRYSGELEEAQARIVALESQLQQPDSNRLLAQAATKTSDLRTPLTALGGYTDLLLHQDIGAVSSQQESLLRRMRVNVDSMARTVDSLSAMADAWQFGQDAAGEVNVHETLEAAIFAISTDLQNKRIRVDLNISNDLPALKESGDGLYHIAIQALTAACLVSAPNGRLFITAVRVEQRNDGKNGFSEATLQKRNYLHLWIGDDGGKRSHGIYALAIGDHGPTHIGHSQSAAAELATKVGPKPSTGLAPALESVARMTSSAGGRMWLDLSRAHGSTLSLLLPYLD